MTAECRWTLVGWVALVACGDAPVGPCDLEDFNRRLARGEDVEASGCDLTGTLVVGPDASFDGIDVSVVSTEGPALIVDRGSVSGLTVTATGRTAAVQVRGRGPASLSDLSVDATAAEVGVALLGAGEVQLTNVQVTGGSYGIAGSRVGDVSAFPSVPGEPGAAEFQDVLISDADVGFWIEVGHVVLQRVRVQNATTVGLGFDVATLAVLDECSVTGGSVGVFTTDGVRLMVDGGSFETTEVGLYLDDSRIEIENISVHGAELGLVSQSSGLRIGGGLFEGQSVAALDARSGSLRLQGTVIECSGAGGAPGDGVRARELTAPFLTDVSISDCARVGFVWSPPVGEPSDVGTASISGEGLGAIAQSESMVFPQGEWSAGLERPAAMVARDEAQTTTLSFEDVELAVPDPLDLEALGVSDAP